MKTDIEIGQKYGRFTVIAEAGVKYSWTKYFTCRCECGNEADYPAWVILNKPNRHCRKCAPHTGGLPEPDLAGQTINGWEILEKVERVNGQVSFLCRCTKCGIESIHSASTIRWNRTQRCRQCAHDYQFSIVGDMATGYLNDGSEFMIDAEDVDRVRQMTWRVNAQGYISHPNRPKKGNTLLHRMLAGVNDPKVMVDHINRNRMDCRKSNLRIISPFGNSCNHKLFETNKTGYTGVYYSRHSGRYEVKIGYNHKRIKLGTSKDDLITLAQMYNIGAQFFFGEYVGELNDVPPPSEELVRQVIEKCRKYKEAPAKAAGVSVA